MNTLLSDVDAQSGLGASPDDHDVPSSITNEPIFPLELFRPIIEHVNATDYRTFHSLSLVSRAISRETEPLFYHTVRLTGLTPNRLFLETIQSTPRLAPHVVEYSIYVDPARSYISEYVQAALRDTLRSCFNLESFSFKAPRDRMGLIPDILMGTRFQLRRLKWDRPPDEWILGPFLQEQHELEELDVMWSYQRAVLVTPDVVPNLTRLSGDQGTMAAFMPGRQITTLTWMSPYDDMRPIDSEPMQEAFTHLWALRTVPGNLERIAAWTKNLVVIEITQAEERDIDVFYDLPRLHTAILSYADTDPGNRVLYSTVLQAVGSKRTSVEVIYIGCWPREEYLRVTPRGDRLVHFQPDAFFAYS